MANVVNYSAIPPHDLAYGNASARLTKQIEFARLMLNAQKQDVKRNIKALTTHYNNLSAQNKNVKVELPKAWTTY